MEGAKESSSFGFSWADEVEREEELEKQNQTRIQIQREKHRVGENIKRSDPFGAARPREVILEGKGVDWKKLDQDFNFDSSIRECKTKRTMKKKPLVTLPCQQTVACEEFVPPLKYPPKNIDSVFEEIHRARKLKPGNRVNLNSKTNEDQSDHGNMVLTGSDKTHRVSKVSTNRKTLSNLNGVLVNRNKKNTESEYVVKEKTGSNFEAKSDKENGMKEKEKEEEPVQRRILVELNTCNSSCKKVTCSNSYFGVLELLEPNSHEKSNSGKSIGDGRNARKRNRIPANEELEAGKKNQERPTTINKWKKGKRSKR